jgi:DNA-binding protein HU-beta
MGLRPQNRNDVPVAILLRSRIDSEMSANALIRRRDVSISAHPSERAISGTHVESCFPSGLESYFLAEAHFAPLRRASIMAGKAMTSGKSGRPVTLKHLAARLAADHELTKRAGEAILSDLVSLITKHLKKGERIRIAGFGILQVRTRAARMGRNPATGEAIKIKASKKVAFRPAKHLKMAV